MYHYETHEGDATQEFVTAPLPRGCDWPEVKDRVEKVKVMASEFSDSSDDRYEIIAYDVDGEEIGRKEIPGY